MSNRNYLIESRRNALRGVSFKVRTKFLFETPELYAEYLRVCLRYRAYLNRLRKLSTKDNNVDAFFRVDNSLIRMFRDRSVRKDRKIEAYYYLLAEADKLPLDLRYRVSLEDFVVHLRVFGDTFSKDSRTLLGDLNTLSNEDYFRILDSVFDTNTLIIYMYRVRKRLLIYLKKGIIYTTSRVTHKLLNRVDSIPKNYFTLREKKVIDYKGEVCLIRDRVRFFKDYYC